MATCMWIIGILALWLGLWAVLITMSGKYLDGTVKGIFERKEAYDKKRKRKGYGNQD